MDVLLSGGSSALLFVVLLEPRHPMARVATIGIAALAVLSNPPPVNMSIRSPCHAILIQTIPRAWYFISITDIM